MRVNGLYGHVRSNEARSLALFVGFVAAFHMLAAVALFTPLAMFDPRHAPVFGWSGYLVLWAPLVTLAGGALFAAQMAWHVHAVRRRTEFRFVDGDDEPRLCRIVEPLAIAAGVPTPYVAVIDSPALNAFACGVRRRDAVLVFTRGLVDGLDDGQLAAVAAHELAHVAGGDIRLMAAADICLGSLDLLQRRRPRTPRSRIGEVVALPVAAAVMPPLALLVLGACLLQRLATDAGRLTRLLIASAREFVADAEAVRLTHDPAALVSALRLIHGRSRLEGVAAGRDAMMIDGASQGAFATHPTIAARIAAITAVTGSLAVIAPARRDTRGAAGPRAPSPSPAGGFGRRRMEPAADAAPRAAVNRLGLTPEMSVGAVAALAVFLFLHAHQLATPSAIASAFDPRPLRAIFTAAGLGARCEVAGAAALAGRGEAPKTCGTADSGLGTFHIGGRAEGAGP